MARSLARTWSAADLQSPIECLCSSAFPGAMVVIGFALHQNCKKRFWADRAPRPHKFTAITKIQRRHDSAIAKGLFHAMTINYWLMKSEPTTFSIEDLAGQPDQTTCWEGVRNYQARNMLRDDIQVGDRVLFYHSACKVPAVVGTAVVSKSGYPDPFQFDRKSNYFDAKSDPENPRWYLVDIKLEKKFERPVTLAELRERAGLKGMVLLQKGSRLSVQPVKKKEFETIEKLASKPA